MRSFELSLGRYAIEIRWQTDDLPESSTDAPVIGVLSLWVQGCLRKERAVVADRPAYLWTNIELEWEEHRYLEVRLSPLNEGGVLRATINSESVLEDCIN